MADQTKATITLLVRHIVETADALTNEYIEQVKLNASNAMGIPPNISVSIQKLCPRDVQFSERLGLFVEQYGLYVLMLLLLAVMAVFDSETEK